MTNMLHDIEPGPPKTTTQAQIDDLAAKVDGLDAHHKARLQGHDQSIRRMAARVELLESWTRDQIFARTAMDEPEDWDAPEPETLPIGVFVKHVWEQLQGNDDFGHIRRMDIHKILSLAAPADRAVVSCKVTDSLVDDVIDYAGVEGTIAPNKVRIMLEYAAHYWPADRAVAVSRLTDAMVERILDTLLDDSDFARSIRNAVDDALRAAERGEES